MMENAMAEKHQVLLERIAVVASFLLIAFACFKIVLPFLGPVMWSVIIVVATWPLFARLKNRLGTRSRLATLIMTVVLSLVLVVPLVILTVSLSDQINNTRDLIKDLSQVTLPENPPEWISKIPFINTRLEKLWHDASTDMQGLVDQIRPQIRTATTWLLAQGARLGLVLLQFVLVLVISAVLFSNGDAMAGHCRKMAERLGGEGGISSLETAADTIKKVSLGVICTAAIQAVLSGFGFWLADVPGWVLLTFFCFFLAMLQVGTGLIWIPVSVWLFYKDANGWAIFTIAWGVFINISDNFIKPFLISHGGKLPIALIFMGVIGGLLTWGFIGIFLGPTLLAIGYNLLHLWLEQEPVK
jgi:predicted PurR-regulated permease PerM